MVEGLGLRNQNLLLNTSDTLIGTLMGLPSRVLRTAGLEKLSVRLPLNCPEAIATSARLAVMLEAHDHDVNGVVLCTLRVCTLAKSVFGTPNLRLQTLRVQTYSL